VFSLLASSLRAADRVAQPPPWEFTGSALGPLLPYHRRDACRQSTNAIYTPVDRGWNVAADFRPPNAKRSSAAGVPVPGGDAQAHPHRASSSSLGSAPSADDVVGLPADLMERRLRA
jgi:hypothetical protein